MDASLNATINSTLNNTAVSNNDGSSFGFYLIIFFILFLIVKNKKNEKIFKEVKHEKEANALDKVIGLESVKEEIRYYMDFINNKEKYIKWNVKLPKGILLAGPPGT